MHIFIRMIRSSTVGPVPPASNVRWNLAAFVIVTASNAIVTTLIAVRIWYLSPRRRRDVLGPNFPTRTGRAAFAIVVESGMLYLAVQLCFIILYSIRHPAQAIISMMAVQIYVRIRRLNGKSLSIRYPNLHRVSHRH